MVVSASQVWWFPVFSFSPWVWSQPWHVFVAFHAILNSAFRFTVFSSPGCRDSHYKPSVSIYIYIHLSQRYAPVFVPNLPALYGSPHHAGQRFTMLVISHHCDWFLGNLTSSSHPLQRAFGNLFDVELLYRGVFTLRMRCSCLCYSLFMEISISSPGVIGRKWGQWNNADCQNSFPVQFIPQAERRIKHSNRASKVNIAHIQR